MRMTQSGNMAEAEACRLPSAPRLQTAVQRRGRFHAHRCPGALSGPGPRKSRLPAEHRHLPPAWAPLCHCSTEMAQAAPAPSPLRRRARVAKRLPRTLSQAATLRPPSASGPLRSASRSCAPPAWDPAGCVAAASVIKGSDAAVYTASYIYLQEQDVEFSFNDEKSLSKDNSLHSLCI